MLVDQSFQAVENVRLDIVWEITKTRCVDGKNSAAFGTSATTKPQHFKWKRLAKQLPSMNQRIKAAYLNTRAFVSYIQETLPEAKINFVSEALASQGFTPSVFSLDLPTKGATACRKRGVQTKVEPSTNPANDY